MATRDEFIPGDMQIGVIAAAQEALARMEGRRRDLIAQIEKAKR